MKVIFITIAINSVNSPLLNKFTCIPLLKRIQELKNNTIANIEANTQYVSDGSILKAKSKTPILKNKNILPPLSSWKEYNYKHSKK